MAVPCATPASADWLGAERQLTFGDGGQQWPQLSGSKLVYSDHTNERTLGDVTVFDIRVRDLAKGTDTLLTPAHTATGRAAVSGDRVVWADRGDGTDAGIWYANLASGERRRLDARPGDDVAISGTRVCYAYLNRIWVYDLRTGSDTAVSPAVGGASDCDISGRVVVWQDHRSGDWDIVSYDLGSGVETRLTSNPADQTMPRIDDGLVVWADARNGVDNTDIYAYDLASGTETQVTGADGVQWFPDVSDGRVVWMDERLGHGNTEVYLYDVATGVETRVSHDDGWSGDPSISGANVVYEDIRPSGHNLYLRTVSPPTLTAALDDSTVDGQPAVTGQLRGPDGVPVIAATLQLESSSDGRDWQAVGTVATAGDGSYSIDLPGGPGSLELRVRFAGGQDYAPAVSSPLHVAAVTPPPPPR